MDQVNVVRSSSPLDRYCKNCLLAIRLLTAAHRPRLSETEQKWFVFETSCYAFGERIRPITVSYALNIVIITGHLIDNICYFMTYVWLLRILQLFQLSL